METPDEKPDARSAGKNPPRPRTDTVGTGANRLPAKATETARKIVRDIAAVPPRSEHPALVPGV